MKFSFLMPTRVIFGKECVTQNADVFHSYGNRAFIVTGRKSAQASGALEDVLQVLREQGMTWSLFDGIGENPTLSMIQAGTDSIRTFRPDVVIAIGGGSPLDAAKAIAVLATNNMQPEDLFQSNFTIEALPILAIPLTAGTGSEVTPYSILTDDNLETKRSFANPMIFPKVAFLDARYTESQSNDLSINTAIDALSHGLEGYVSMRANFLSDCLALEAMRYFRIALDGSLSRNLTFSHREALLYSSLLGGMVIAQTGTTAVHSLGYSLTYFRNIPHGRANGLLLPAYLKFIHAVQPEKVKNILRVLNLLSIDDFRDIMNKLIENVYLITEDDIEKFAGIAIKAKNIANTPKNPDVKDLQKILRGSFSLKR